MDHLKNRLKHYHFSNLKFAGLIVCKLKAFLTLLSALFAATCTYDLRSNWFIEKNYLVLQIKAGELFQ